MSPGYKGCWDVLVARSRQAEMNRLRVLIVISMALHALAQETTAPGDPVEAAAEPSMDDQLQSFIDQYCTGANQSFENAFSKALRCQESESLPGMTKVSRSCWKEVMGSSYPADAEEWKTAMCEDDGFMEKKMTITECFQKQISPREEALYLKNFKACFNEN